MPRRGTTEFNGGDSINQKVVDKVMNVLENAMRLEQRGEASVQTDRVGMSAKSSRNMWTDQYELARERSIPSRGRNLCEGKDIDEPGWFPVLGD